MVNKVEHKGILSIDFDDTIASTKFPVIKGLRPHARRIIQKLSNEGWFIIVNTCRTGDNEKEAVDFLKIADVPFNLVNQNHPALCECFGNDCRKISADIYIDDKDINQIGREVDWLDIYRKIKSAEPHIVTMFERHIK